ncbi:MAG: glycosyltransferase [Nitrospirae bacterium]|nr:glycosyltransferase [Nitrospirota bacterium]
MNHSYKITIALLTHNRCESGFLKESLEAILAQTYTDFELLVVDNHSTDNTAEFVMGYEDPRLTYIRQPSGGNASTSYIRSSIMGRGEYIIMAHDDDIMEPTMIERQIAFIENNPELLVVSNNVSLIDDSGVLIQPSLYELDGDIVFRTSEYIKKYFDEKFWLPAPTLLFKRQDYVKAVSRWLGTKDTAYLASGDIWILFTLNLQGSIGLLADPLLRYRQHKGQESRNVDQGYPMIEAIQLFLKNNYRKKRLQPHLAAIHAFLTRFRTQDSFFKTNTKNQILSKLSSLKKNWEKNVMPENRALDTILPFEICLYLFGLKPSVPVGAFSQLKLTSAKGGGRRGFRNWLSALQNGRNLFDSQNSLKKIAVLGSMLNAYLIIESAQQSGIDVLGCFDSSPARIGKQVLDIPVYPIEDLFERSKNLDAIILSSEHDQEDALKMILKKHLKQNQDLPVISWKDLAERSMHQCCPG